MNHLALVKLYLRIELFYLSLLQGSFEQGVRGGGEGRLVDCHGNVYDGRWVGDKMDGPGKMVYANKDEYNGKWTNGAVSGQVLSWIS